MKSFVVIFVKITILNNLNCLLSIIAHSSQMTTPLLSDRFLDIIIKLQTTKQNAWKCYIKHKEQNSKYENVYNEITGKYVNLLSKLNEISKVLISPNNPYDIPSDDSNQFIKNICDGILSDKIINDCWISSNKTFTVDNKICYNYDDVNDEIEFVVHGNSIDQSYLQNLQCLNTFSLENQNIIDLCLDAFSEDYVVSDEIYDSIEKVIGKLDRSNYLTLFLDIHCSSMMYIVDAISDMNLVKSEDSENAAMVLCQILKKNGFNVTLDTIDDFVFNIEPEKFKTIYDCRATIQYLEICMANCSGFDLLKVLPKD